MKISKGIELAKIALQDTKKLSLTQWMDKYKEYPDFYYSEGRKFLNVKIEENDVKIELLVLPSEYIKVGNLAIILGSMYPREIYKILIVDNVHKIVKIERIKGGEE